MRIRRLVTARVLKVVVQRRISQRDVAFTVRAYGLPTSLVMALNIEAEREMFMSTSHLPEHYTFGRWEVEIYFGLGMRYLRVNSMMRDDD